MISRIWQWQSQHDENNTLDLSHPEQTLEEQRAWQMAATDEDPARADEAWDTSQMHSTQEPRQQTLFHGQPSVHSGWAAGGISSSRDHPAAAAAAAAAAVEPCSNNQEGEATPRPKEARRPRVGTRYDRGPIGLLRSSLQMIGAVLTREGALDVAGEVKIHSMLDPINRVRGWLKQQGLAAAVRRAAQRRKTMAGCNHFD